MSDTPKMTDQERIDWHDTSPDTPRVNAARNLNTKALVLEACRLERQNAALREALASNLSTLETTRKRLRDRGMLHLEINQAIEETSAALGQSR